MHHKNSLFNRRWNLIFIFRKNNYRTCILKIFKEVCGRSRKIYQLAMSSFPTNLKEGRHKIDCNEKIEEKFPRMLTLVLMFSLDPPICSSIIIITCAWTRPINDDLWKAKGSYWLFNIIMTEAAYKDRTVRKNSVVQNIFITN